MRACVRACVYVCMLANEALSVRVLVVVPAIAVKRLSGRCLTAGAHVNARVAYHFLEQKEKLDGG